MYIFLVVQQAHLPDSMFSPIQYFVDQNFSFNCPEDKSFATGTAPTAQCFTWILFSILSCQPELFS